MSLKTGLGAYVRRVVPELALVAAASACLAVVVMQGFVVDPALQFNAALVAALSCVCQAVLFAARDASPRRALAVCAAYLLLSAAVVAAGVATSTTADPLADEEGNHLAFCMVLVTVNALVHVLSRRMGSMVALAAAGLFACAFVQYVYQADLLAPTLGFVGCTAALWVERSYARCLGQASEPGREAYGAVAGMGLAAAAVSLALGAAVYALVVAPLDPGHLDVKLFTEYRSFETVQVRNPAEVVVQEDPDEKTVTLTDETLYGSVPVQLDADDPALADLGDFVQDSREVSGSKSVFKLEQVDEGGVYLYTYELPCYWWLLLVALPFVAVALAVLVRKALRARRRSRMAALAPREQVGALYVRLLRDFKVLGVPKPAEQTPTEFARDSADALACFAQGSFGWGELTEVYVRCHYGACKPGPEGLAACWRLYDGHFARAMRLKGRARYCLKYFWLM